MLKLSGTKGHRLNHAVFWPPFTLLIFTLAISIIAPEFFLSSATKANSWIIVTFQELFSWSTFAFLLILIFTYISPFGRVKIGGKEAVPIFSKWRLFSITLCSTVAIGILFWSTAEPIFHLHEPGVLGMVGPSAESRDFAMATLFMHWTFTPYAIYCMGAILFAYGYYNRGQVFSVGTYFFTWRNKAPARWLGNGLDSLCLYSLVGGVSANLGVGILSVSGGLEKLLATQLSGIVIIGIGILIVISFAASAISGLKNGIRILSDINIKGFFFFCIVVLFSIPIGDVLQIGSSGVLNYGKNFLDWSTNWSGSLDTEWSANWTTFYWANWLAWAPITCLFLGQLSRGYDVRTLIRFNLLYPALFSMCWMIIFGGASLFYEIEVDGDPIYTAMQSGGIESAAYAFFDFLPGRKFLTFLFIGLAFLSFVTAADSATNAMSNISTTYSTSDAPESPVLLKLSWGFLVGFMAIIMVSLAGVDGVRMASNLGGLPSLFIFLGIGLSLLRLTVLSYRD